MKQKNINYIKKIYYKFKKLGLSKLNKLSDEELEEFKILEKYNYVDFKELEPPKYPNGFLIHWFIDDLVGTELLKRGRSAFINLCIRNRHVIPGNIIITAQAIKEIPKTIRLNVNLIAMFKFADKSNVLDDIYPLLSSYITKEQFIELYEYATIERHNALVIDATSNKLKFKLNFNKLLNFNND